MAASRWVKVMNLKKLAHQVWMALDSMVVESEEGHGFLEPQDGSKASEKACSMNQFTVIPVPFLIAARWRLTEQILYRFAGRKTRCCVRARFNNVTPSLLHTTAFVFPRTGKLSKGTRLKKETARVCVRLSSSKSARLCPICARPDAEQHSRALSRPLLPRALCQGVGSAVLNGSGL